LSKFGLEIMLFISLIYLVMIWKWNPYNEAVNFHNRILKYNHLTAFLFVGICELMSRFEMSRLMSLLLIYISLLLLAIVSVCGGIRIYV